MTLAAIVLCLSLALLATSTPLTLPTLNLTTPTTPTLTAKAHCFIQPHHPGAPHLFDTSFHECRVALTLLPGGKALSTPYTFSRHPSADVRLPYAKAFRTCKIIIDIMDEVESERLTWGGIQETLEAPKGVLRNCLGQGILPPLGGRTSVGEKGAMQAVVAGQAWKGGAGAVE